MQTNRRFHNYPKKIFLFQAEVTKKGAVKAPYILYFTLCGFRRKKAHLHLLNAQFYLENPTNAILVVSIVIVTIFYGIIRIDLEL